MATAHSHPFSGASHERETVMHGRRDTTFHRVRERPARPSVLSMVLAAITGASIGMAGLILIDEVRQIRLLPTASLEGRAPGWSLNPELDRARLLELKRSLAVPGSHAEASAGTANRLSTAQPTERATAASSPSGSSFGNSGARRDTPWLAPASSAASEDVAGPSGDESAESHSAYPDDVGVLEPNGAEPTALDPPGSEPPSFEFGDNPY